MTSVPEAHLPYWFAALGGHFVLTEPIVYLLHSYSRPRIAPPVVEGWKAEKIKKHQLTETTALTTLTAKAKRRVTTISILFLAITLCVFWGPQHQILEIALAIAFVIGSYYHFKLALEVKSLKDKEEQWEAWGRNAVAKLPVAPEPTKKTRGSRKKL